MENLLIIVNDAPYGTEKAWNALRLANASRSSAIDMHVRIFLMGDSVAVAKKGQNLPEGYYNLEKMLTDLVTKGVDVKTCGTCMKARGITDLELVEGVQRGTMMILANWIKESDRTISF
jgi:uncharacterized protein involved in oxidation of intracellular sulfur